MPDKPPEPPESHELRTIRQLVKLMARFDLTAIDLTSEHKSIRLRRQRNQSANAAVPPPAAAPSLHAPLGAPPGIVEQAPRAVSDAVFIRSPMVGTFYESPSPDAQPYVRVGASVRPDTIVCLIEAMKVFTEINAGVTGAIAEMLVKNGQPVEFDQPLYRIEPA
jgi:acetyl-CoA carboxylase biotin carboxyl carrier protein